MNKYIKIDDPIIITVSRDYEVLPEQAFDAWLDEQNAGKWLFTTPDGVMKKVKIDGRVAKWAVGFVLALWVWTLVSFWIGQTVPIIHVPGENPGMFGDMFGGLNALFTGLAFAGIIFTILLQRKDLGQQRDVLKLQVKELELQRKELTLTQKTLEAQRQEMVEQNKTLQIQRFENTFFSLLDTFNGIIEVLEYENTHTLNKSTGRMVFHDYELEATIAHSIVDNVELNKWFQDKDTLFGPYFRMLYNILLFVERSEVIIQIDGYPNKSFYIHLLRDQLTSHELLFLACIGLYSEGKESFKEFSEKYTLLKMLDKVSPFMPFFEEQYDRSAFG